MHSSLPNSKESFISMVEWIGLHIDDDNISVTRIINGYETPIKLENGGKMPAAVCIYDDIVLFGHDALKQGESDTLSPFEHLTSIAGMQFDSDEFNKLAGTIRYNYKDDMDSCGKIRITPLVTKNCQRVPKTPTQLISMMMKHALDIVREKGFPVEHIMLSYPPSFKEPQIREIFAAAVMTGVEHVDMATRLADTLLFDSISPYLNDYCALVIDCRDNGTDCNVYDVHSGKSPFPFPNYGSKYFTNAIQEKMTKEQKRREGGVGFFSEEKQREFHEAIDTIIINSCEENRKKLAYSEGNEASHITETAVKRACDNLLPHCEAFLKEVLGDVEKQCEAVQNEEREKMEKQYETALQAVLKEVKKRNQTITHVVLSGGGMRLHCLNKAICDIFKVENTMTSSADAVTYRTVPTAKRMNALHEPGDMCLAYALCSQIDEPITINSRSTMPSYHESPSVEQEEPTEESQETTLCLTQHPILPPTRPNERDLNSSSFTIEEKRAYNIYLKNSNGFTKVLDKEEALPYESKPYKLGVNSTNIRVTLYEGLSSRIEDCRAIRQIILECDDYHKQIIEEKRKQIIEEKRKSGDKSSFPFMLLTVTVRSDGLLSVKTQWKDTETALKVLEDKPVPPNYRESSQKFDTVSEEWRETETKSSVSKGVSEEDRETSPQSTETHFNPPFFDSFSLQDSVPSPVICERSETDDPVPIMSNKIVSVQPPKKSESAAPPSAKMGSGCTIF